MDAKEYGRLLAQQAPPITRAQAEEVARILCASWEKKRQAAS